MTRCIPQSRSRYALKYAASAGAVVISSMLVSGPAYAQSIWTGATDSSWATSTNWNPSGVPNAVGAEADFQDPAATRTITVDSGTNGFTVGTIGFTTNSAFNTSLDRGLAGSKLILDNGGAGAMIAVGGSGTGIVTFIQQLPLTMNDDLTVKIDATNVTASVGALTINGNMTGSKGLIKTGNGLMTLSTNGKGYTGATVVNAGRLRMSFSGRPTATSSFTVNAGGQLVMTIGANNIYSFGAGNLNLNGTGPTAGPFASLPGALRPDPNLALSISNAVVLQSDAMIHIEGATGATTLSNTVSGPGKLTLGAPNSSATPGVLILGATNSYQGGTLIAAGSINLSAPAAKLGTGDVEINNASSPLSPARLSIAAGVLDAISDTATLNLAGGGAANTADQNYVILGTGVNENVGGLVLGGAMQLNYLQTYGSVASGAQNQFDEYFSGNGTVTLVPEPGALALLAFSATTLVGRRRRSAR